jgi:phosphoglycerate dehydrogenase-like enzyme
MRLELVSDLLFMVSFLCASKSLTRAALVPRFSVRPLYQTSTLLKMQYWNREESPPQNYTSNAPIVKHAKIISLSDVNDDANAAVNHGELPQGASLLAIGGSMDDFDVADLKQQEPNVVFVAHPKARQPLADLLTALPSIEWVHARSAGIDFITSPTLSSTHATVTNAKGTFSSTLAEYTLMACSYFAKNIPRLTLQKQDKNWSKYSVLELRGATLGIIGYGDIGRACAKLANAYGMNVVALRRRRPTTEDELCRAVYENSRDNLYKLMGESDYILCSAPLTPETRGMLDAEAFARAKRDSVFINVGRGPIVNENALIDALLNGRLKGAALDVFETEPLPTSSELWNLPNVLLSPHNMDQTDTFMHEATEFFVTENLPRFVRGETLLNPVDPAAGY